MAENREVKCARLKLKYVDLVSYLNEDLSVETNYLLFSGVTCMC